LIERSSDGARGSGFELEQSRSSGFFLFTEMPLGWEKLELTLFAQNDLPWFTQILRKPGSGLEKKNTRRVLVVDPTLAFWLMRIRTRDTLDARVRPLAILITNSMHGI
jgi:hypothetical protein